MPLLSLFHVQGQRFEAKAEAVIANTPAPYHGPAWLLYGLSLDDSGPNPRQSNVVYATIPLSKVQKPNQAFTVLRPELRPWHPEHLTTALLILLMIDNKQKIHATRNCYNKE